LDPHGNVGQKKKKKGNTISGGKVQPSALEKGENSPKGKGPKSFPTKEKEPPCGRRLAAPIYDS